MRTDESTLRVHLGIPPVAGGEVVVPLSGAIASVRLLFRRR